MPSALLAALALLPSPAAQAPEPPAGLACLARWYGGAPAHEDAGWVLKLGDTAIVWEDGVARVGDDRLDHADLADSLAIPYPAGPVAPVTTPDDDPGRARSEALMHAVYGGSADAVRAHFADVAFVGQTVRVHERVAAPLARVAARLDAAVAADPTLAPFVTGALGGTFNWRVVAGTARLSPHSWATAIDLVVARSDYWKWDVDRGAPLAWKNRIPAPVVAAFEAEGFAWGGRWYHYDTMHFEYRPELFDPACRPPEAEQR